MAVRESGPSSGNSRDSRKAEAAAEYFVRLSLLDT